MHLVKRSPFWLSLLALFAIFFDLGFSQSPLALTLLKLGYMVAFSVEWISLVGRYFFSTTKPSRISVWLFDGALFVLLAGLLFTSLGIFHMDALETKSAYFIAIFLVFFREFSALKIEFTAHYLNPARLFILSFVGIIMLGTILLMLPKATHDGISAIDALFTSTSAVCVTGLIVVDTGSYFTQFGQNVIMVLIQLGGLGIMTFTSYFSYFFRGGSTYENQLLLKDMTNAEKIAEVFSTLKKIILITFLIEATGAILIYFNLDDQLIPTFGDRAFFSIFHSISGFCNAGFSTLQNSLYEPGYRFNYPLHLILAGLFILGGIGFPILFNTYKYLKYIIMKNLPFIDPEKKQVYVPWILNINTRIIVMTTLILIVFGTIIFYGLEYNNTLAEHSGFGKIVTAFFGAVTPRTAGFNSVDTGALRESTLLFTFLLMWIGASPASTGGGIKTSTFAIAIINALNLARSKHRIELFQREVADQSVRRAFAIITLSLVVISLSVFFVAAFDGEKGLLPIAFESISAYGTVGLSMGITSQLTGASKLVLVITMFIGRVSMLTILIAVLRKVKYMKYRYPKEEILIN